MARRKRTPSIGSERARWERECVAPARERLGPGTAPCRVATPEDTAGLDYARDLGFPGEYPFTRGAYPTRAPGERGVQGGPLPIPVYSGYGAAEDTREFYRTLVTAGARGANVAFDLPTQCGLDSDDSRAHGEVGKTGVAVDTLRDLEVIFEAFDGVDTLDRMRANFTINAPCAVIMAMFFALAERKGVPLERLNPGGTPQNDILKEFMARGAYIFPPGPSMRLVRDFFAFCHRHVPRMNLISICEYHIREAGATPVQGLAFVLANAMAYVREGMAVGLGPDDFVDRFTFLCGSGSMDFWAEVAQARAKRRMWARIMRERFGARDPRSWVFRANTAGGGVGAYNYTGQRPVNNIIREVLGAVGEFIAGTEPGRGGTPYDEPFGLGHSREARQIARDLARILQHESGLGAGVDPLGGSYLVEALTSEIEAQAWELLEKVEAMGGAVRAVEEGFPQREIAASAYEFQRQVERGERLIVGVNAFTGEGEIEVEISRHHDHPYDPARMETAELRQQAALAEVKRVRDGREVARRLREVEQAARGEANLMGPILEAVRTYATVGEVCDALRAVFGEWREQAVV